MNYECDTLVVGAGPAGLTAAWQVAATGRRVVLIDAGPDLHERICPSIKTGVCPPCRSCDLLRGVGGASGIIGGKLCYFPAGDRLARLVGLSSTDANEVCANLLRELKVNMPMPDAPHHGHLIPENQVGWAGSGKSTKPYQAFPVLSAALRELFQSLRGMVIQHGATLLPRTELRQLTSGVGQAVFNAILVRNGVDICLRIREAVLLATGRATSPWLTKVLTSLGVKCDMGNVDVGIRLECETTRVRELLSHLEDPKMLLRAGSDKEVRTLCWCRGGSMTVTHMNRYQLVDGHFGPIYSDRASVSIVARRPCDPAILPLEYAAKMMGCSEGDRPTTIDLRRFLGRARSRTTLLPVIFPCKTVEMQPRRLSTNLLLDLQEFVVALSDGTEGTLLDDPTAVVYGPVIDQQWPIPEIGADLQTTVPGLFMAGDIQGRGRGIIQAVLSGWVAGRAMSGEWDCSNSKVEVGAYEA
ncbi:hypothetical protein PHYC_01551 [Phycisphaerales bacterium]|nr:hypothetical protein PHYC_01551 [Phycisphaerales bacterium]